MRSRRRLLGPLVVLLAGMLLSVLTAAPAAAHNGLRSTNPAADARVDTTPAAIVLTFDEPAIAMGTRIVVTGPSGPVHSGAPQLVDNTVTQVLQPRAPAGRYVVEWRVTSEDGHPITGSFAFTSAAAGTGEPPLTPARTTASEPATSETAGGGSGWGALVAVLALVVVLAGMLFVFRQARSTAPRYDRSASPEPAPEQSLEPSPAESRTESRPPTDD